MDARAKPYGNVRAPVHRDRLFGGVVGMRGFLAHSTRAAHTAGGAVKRVAPVPVASEERQAGEF